MSVIVVLALAITAVIVVAGLVLLVVVLREAWPSRDRWAEEDRAAGEDTRRDAADRDFPFGPGPPAF
jgi:hypothetical protein